MRCFFTGNTNRWVTIAALCMLGFFGIEMLYASLSLSTKEMPAAAATATHKISVTHWENGEGIKLRISSTSLP